MVRLTMTLCGAIMPFCCTLSGCTGAAAVQSDPEPLYEDLLFRQMDREDQPSRRPQLASNIIVIPGNREDDQYPPLPVDNRDPDGWTDFLVDFGDGGSQSIGKCSRGRLNNGRELPPNGPGYVRKNQKAVFGTDETVAMVAWAAAQMTILYPGTSPLVVGDLSREEGGRLRPHKSHQSGRDVDLGYYQLGNARTAYFEEVTSLTIDAEKTWTLIELLLSTLQIEYIFIDRSLHKVLYDEAQRRGWDANELGDVFEAPLGNLPGRGIIRHTRGHKHHMHVRFVCPGGDAECE